ncbi:putative MFS family arabinose efflux permease [Sphingobium sp. OAS761]|uniref:spinster family MFS transporter n=1 Tax=Sphingobium sp. OAS761 TaxID=2817901 RepID=UPI0020A2020E|nr:MFS transporter [Sphingobium sp. OAS761]MCP1470351.1 putative MFS family arabinose efflux permease [Sphingobium sp. OAS761]
MEAAAPLAAENDMRSRPPAISAGRRRAMLFMLCFIYMLNYLDRQIIVILQEPIKHEFQLQDWHLGLLTGAAFGFFYTIMGVPIAQIVDRGINRVRMLSGLLAIWSAMTAICGLSRGYAHFFMARMGVGLAESGFTPTAHALISDLYPPAERPRALGVFSVGIPFGVMAGLSIGGLVAAYSDWRTALFVAGAPGIVAAILFWLFAREPMRGAMDRQQKEDGHKALIPFGQALKLLLRRASFVHVTIATAVTSFVEAGMMAWIPSYLIRSHGLPLSQVGPSMGLIAGAGGVIGTMFGGWQATRFGRNGMDRTLWLPVVGLLLCIPLYATVFYVDSGRLALGMLLLPTIFGAFWTAPAIALTQNLAPVATRARAAAVRIVAANLIGVSAGPLVCGMLSDHFGKAYGAPSIGLRMALMVFAGLFAWAAVHWLVTVRALQREKAELPAQA